MPHVTLLPAAVDAASADLYLDRATVSARVVFSDDNEGDLHEERLFGAISSRHSWRLPFAQRAIDEVPIARLVSAAAVEGCRLAVLTDAADRAALARIVSVGDRRQWQRGSAPAAPAMMASPPTRLARMTSSLASPAASSAPLTLAVRAPPTTAPSQMVRRYCASCSAMVIMSSTGFKRGRLSIACC